MKVQFIWILGVIIWNFGFPSAIERGLFNLAEFFSLI